MSGTIDDSALRLINTIATRLHDIFDGRINLTDVASKSQAHVEPFFRTRALAALALLNESGVSAEIAGSSITDSGNDDGIDGIFIDRNENKIYFVQSKWRNSPKKGVELQDFVRFRDGVRAILALNWSADNSSLAPFKEQLEEALRNIDTRVMMILVHTSAQDIAKNIQSKIDEFVKSQNKYVSDFLEFKSLGLSDVVQAARFQARPENITVDVLLENWGIVREPYKAIYGSVAALDVVRWHDEHGKRLFAENLRYTIEKSSINEGIIQTAENLPHHFWYFNNGITAICEGFDKQPIGGNSTETGVFSIRRVSVINGAQTIGSLARARNKGAGLETARVQIRIISLDGTPDGFSMSVTNANNTQNNLSPIDFVASDATQERLRKEAAILGLIYTFRRGDTEPDQDVGFDIRSATIAAACACGDLRLAVASKRYISGLWENTSKEPYTKLFNADTTAKYLWYIVRVMRRVDDRLMQKSNSLSGKEKLIAIHGNRFILYYLFNNLKTNNMFVIDDFESVAGKIDSVTDDTLIRMTEKVIKLFPEAYAGNIFKNNERQQQILAQI